MRPKVYSLDLRILDRHPLASVGTLVLGLRCHMVSGVSADAEADRVAVPPAVRAQTGTT